MNEPEILIDEVDATISVVCLNRPKRRNALSLALMQSLCNQMVTLSGDDRKRVVILHGSGPVFSAGLDLFEAADSEYFEQSAAWVAQLLDTIKSCPLITIAAVHGAALAGGAGIMAACDLVVAAEDTMIGFPEVRRGMVPALVTTVLRHKLTDSVLRELLLLGEPIWADRAREIGLVQHVVSGGELMKKAHEMARRFTQSAPAAVKHTKQLLNEAHVLDDKTFYHRALETHKQSRQSDEVEEGLTAFREKRKPRWK